MMKVKIAMVKPFVAVMAGLFVGAASLSGAQTDTVETMSPPEIWEGYDPRAEPLDEEVLKTWEQDGVRYKEVYFNGEQFDGEYVRIYGMYAAPIGGKNLPALVHLHGGGQTVNESWLKTLTSRGYAVMTFNWGGEWPNRQRYTLWNGVENGDHKNRTRREVTLPTPRSDSYYLWTQASMRAVTYLERQPEVNPDKIGAYGISMGGSMMWNIAFDSRIEAGCAIYGTGWNTYTYEDTRYSVGMPEHQPSANDLRWRASLAPEASAPYVKFPMLFLSSTNDRHGYMDRAEQTLDLIPAGVPRAWALTPRLRHHIGLDFVHDLPAWFDVHLKGEGVWPDNPETAMTLGQNAVPQFTVNPANKQDVVKVEVFYGLETPFAVNRHWRNATVRESGGRYIATTPVMNAAEYLFAFANIFYKSGVVISSPLEAVIPSTMGAAATIKEPSRVFYDGQEGVGSWTRNSTGTDPIPGRIDKRLMAAVGPEGKPGFSADRVNPFTYAPSDPEFRAPKGASLQFDIKTETGEEFAVKLHKNYWVADFQTYSCKVDLDADRGWQTVTLPSSRFQNDKGGASLGDTINEVGGLELSPQNRKWQDTKVIFRNFRWVGGEYVPHVHAYRKKDAELVAGVTSSDDADHLQDHEAVKSNDGNASHSVDALRKEDDEFSNLRRVKEESVFNIKTYGAIGDGVAVSTESVQKAIDACHAAGGGVVWVPTGEYVIGTIRLKSNITLTLDHGASLLGSQDFADYATDLTKPREGWAQCLIYAEDATHITIEGLGVIDGRGTREAFPWGKGPSPRLMRMENCDHLKFSGVTYRRSAFWGLHLVDCRNVHFDAVTIFSRENNRGNDGIDMDGCENVLVENCDINSGDDAICLKSSLNPCRNIVVRNCKVSSGTAPLKFGASSYGGFIDVRVTNCYFYDSPSGAIKLELVDGGRLENVAISRIVMEDVGNPIFIRLGSRGRTYDKSPKGDERVRAEVGSVKNIRISDVVAEVTMENKTKAISDLTDREKSKAGPIMITGIPGHMIEDVVLENIKISYPGYGSEEEAKRVVPEDEDRYPEQFFFGVLPAWGAYIRHAKNVEFNNVELTLRGEDARQKIVLDDVISFNEIN
ncbi:Exo-poly-alpha-D-galacturonosidase precursor [Novipirellula aureliae]|uniref:Exo-poly-alpha-D-galacturonosidase n=1 Tax=Novipirellula aureliae TaxID=2527966 RepID=A0A5C6DRQ3_9BACT|nr:glycosyl hydrolase family 28 protein [Novipirellula aureliae]TWU38894.1 Exo-poly-alpha-D-galacturonosidase precursor [Novipirellula aureliae]